MTIVARAIALLLSSMLPVTVSAQTTEITATQVTERLTEWDQAYARLKRDIWNLQRATAMFGRDFRGRALNDDLRDFALLRPTEKRLSEQRALTIAQLAKGDTRLATETLLGLYRELRNELEGLERIGEHRVRHRQVAQQRTLWQQLAIATPHYQTPESIRALEQHAVEQLNAGRFAQTTDTTYPALLREYAQERERLFKNTAQMQSTANKSIVYARRSPCPATATTTTDKPEPALANTTYPDYPDASRRANEEGIVYVQLLAGRTGCALRYAIQLSSGWPNLDDAALDWVETIAFVPGAKDGNAIDTWVTIPVTFRLND